MNSASGNRFEGWGPYPILFILTKNEMVQDLNSARRVRLNPKKREKAREKQDFIIKDNNVFIRKESRHFSTDDEEILTLIELENVDDINIAWRSTCM